MGTWTEADMWTLMEVWRLERELEEMRRKRWAGWRDHRHAAGGPSAHRAGDTSRSGASRAEQANEGVGLPRQPRILVPLGESPTADAAVPVAARLAYDLRADVVLLRVVAPPASGWRRGAGDLLPAVDRAERHADAALRRYEQAFDGLRVCRVVLVGRPAAEIVVWLRQQPVDLVVMASRVRSRLRRLVTGSLVEAVQRSGLAPVVVVHSPPPADAGRPRLQVREA